MELQQLKSTVKTQCKGVYAKYVLILILFTLVMSIFNTGVPVDVLLEQPLLYIPYLIAMIVIIVARNTIYFLWIKRVRKEALQMQDIKYSFTKVLTHLATALLFELAQLGLVMIIQLITSFMPILALPLVVIVQAVLSSVSVFIAFAIYDGVKRALAIVNGSFRLLKQHIKTVFFLALPFMIWLMLYQLAENFVLMSMVKDTADTTITTLELLEIGFADAALIPYAYGWIALSLVNIVISSSLLVPLYLAFANIYEQEYMNHYPFTAQLRTNFIDIEK